MSAEWTLIEGDNLAFLKTLPDNHADSIVQDPPSWITFMGQQWDRPDGLDHFKLVAQECLRVLKPGGHALTWAFPKTSDLTGYALRQAGFEMRGKVYHLFGSGFPRGMDISKAIDKELGVERQVLGTFQRNRPGARPTIGPTGHSGQEKLTQPATVQAEWWEGWNTELKPSAEEWILCRKPIAERTVAANVLRWGTGGINIGACRLETKAKSYKDGRIVKTNDVYGKYQPADYDGSAGRFPPNVMLSGEAIDELELQHSGGSAFFYCAKSSSRERNQGCEGLPLGTPPNGRRSIPAAGRKNIAGEPRANHHKTVKPLALMEWLIRLITPNGGLVLDPYSGSGSTGVAAISNGFRFLGMEREPEYYRIAEARLSHAAQQQEAA